MAYNGHRSHAAWNVSLWIHNDEGLYTFAREVVRKCRTLDRAAQVFMDAMEGCETPDGVPYTLTNVRRALSRDM